MIHEELQQLLGAYSIDAVDAEEAAAVEAHLTDCPRCRAEVAELREVAALLSHSGADAPEGVWDRIASSLTEPAPALRLEVQRDRRWSRGRVLRTSAVAVAAAVLVVLGFSVLRLRGQVDDLRNARALANDTTEVALAAAQAMSAPDARIARLSGEQGQTAVAVVRSNGQGYFLGTQLPNLSHRIYQLWGATSSGQVTSLGTVPGPGVYAFAADRSVQVVMVTEEDAPVPAPTSAAIVTGALA
jgi:anti-sigma factor RsiW